MFASSGRTESQWPLDGSNWIAFLFAFSYTWASLHVKVVFNNGPILSLQPKPHFRWSPVLVSKFWQDDEGPGRKKPLQRVPPNRIQWGEPTFLACLWRLEERAEQKSHRRKGQNDIWRLHFYPITKRGKNLADSDVGFLRPRMNWKGPLSKLSHAWGEDRLEGFPGQIVQIPFWESTWPRVWG